MIKLDYNIPSPQDRNKLVTEMVSEIGEENLSEKSLEIMADYLVFCMEKEEKRQKKILTDNRMTTVNKRESSMEGLTDKLENGEDGLYNLIINDKNVILTPPVSITEQDLRDIPPLKQLRESIIEFSKLHFEGKDAFKAKRMVIELRQDQYIIKNAYRRPIYFLRAGRGSQKINWNSDTLYFKGDTQVEVSRNTLDLTNYRHISALLCNYSLLKEKTHEEFENEIRWVLMDLENIIDSVLKENYPMYYDIVVYKIDGKSNQEIQTLLENEYGSTHSQEYISSLFRNKIPKLIADGFQEQWMMWFHTFKVKGEWKTCSRCGETKLAHNRYFSKNKTAKGGFYSICKVCRNKKN